MMPPAIFPDLANVSVLITGGGSGIGAKLVEGFVRQHAKIAFIDFAEAPSRALCDEIVTRCRAYPPPCRAARTGLPPAVSVTAWRARRHAARPASRRRRPP